MQIGGTRGKQCRTARGRAAGAINEPAACRLKPARTGGRQVRSSTGGGEGGVEPPASAAYAARNACGKLVIGGAQAVVWERRRESGAFPHAAPVLERARGYKRPRARWTGRHSGPETHGVCPRAPRGGKISGRGLHSHAGSRNAAHKARRTDALTPPAASGAPSTAPPGPLKRHTPSCSTVVTGRPPVTGWSGRGHTGSGAHPTQEATQSDHGPADSWPHRIRLPPDLF